MGAPIGRHSGAALARFADERGLTFTQEAELPKSTPLLISGEATTTHIVSGDLPGFIGLLAAYTFTQSSNDSNQAPTYREVTVAMTRVPESIKYIPSLTARDASTRGFTERLVGAGGLIPIYDRLELESIKFNTSYRVGVLKNQDESFIRQLFPPSFIDYMAERAPDGCYFDLMWGVLLVATNEPVSDSAEIEEFCGFTAHVADRIRDECRESIELAPDDESMVSEPMRKAEASRDEWVDRVDWEEPPESVKEASRPYRRFALARPLTWIGSTVFAALFALVIAGITAFFSITFLGEYALFVFLGLGALVFAWSFIAMLRGSVRHQTVDWGLVAFVRGYGAKRKLEWEPGSQFAARHSHTHIGGGVAAALRGKAPGSNRDGTLVFSVDPSGRGRKLSGSMALATEFAGRESEALMLFPRDVKDAPTALGGFMVKGAKGVRESDSDREARERAERIGKEILGGEPFGILLEGGELSIYSDRMPALDWDAERVDEFAERAAAAAGRLEAELAPKKRARRKKRASA